MTNRNAYHSTGTSLPPRAAAGAFAAMLVACLSGCAPPVASVAPVGMAALSRVSESAATPSGATSATVPETPDKQEQTGRCAQLLAAQPGVEEIRITSAGATESREIRLDSSQPHAQWVVYRHRDSATDGWRPQPGIAQLQFVPSLGGTLSSGEPKYLAYAPAIADKPEDSEEMVSIAENFGSQAGTFRWRSRTYNYVLVKKLPCFPGPE